MMFARRRQAQQRQLAAKEKAELSSRAANSVAAISDLVSRQADESEKAEQIAKELTTPKSQKKGKH